MRFFPSLFIIPVLFVAAVGGLAQPPDYTVYLIPNTHGTVAGWLVNFDTERSYVLNNHVDHLNRVASDETYALAISEVTNVMALLKFHPEQLERARKLAKERRVEFVNGFFIEPTVNLSGGEALAQMATLGQRWYQDVLGLRPRFAWMIDVCGLHEQMPQLVSEAGLEALFFSRNNPMPKDAFMWVAPDGSKTPTFALGPGYAAGRVMFNTEEPMTGAQYEDMAQAFSEGHEHAVSPRHLLMGAGGGDYSEAPKRAAYPAEFLKQWRTRYPKVEVRMATPGQYVDAIQKEIRDGKIKLDEYRGNAAYSYNAFWMNMPEVKRDYRVSEHTLQAAEMMATKASLTNGDDYPAQGFYGSWIQMMINMDRNVLWGAGSGSPFYDSHHWNTWDRFESVLKQSWQALDGAFESLTSQGDSITLYNPLNWVRNDPVTLTLPPGKQLEDVACESRPGTDDVVCIIDQPSTSLVSLPLSQGATVSAAEEEFNPEVRTDHYIARFDPRNGSLVSLRDKATGKEYLAGPANVIQAESVEGVVKDPTNWMAPRPMRKITDSTSERQASFQVFRGPLTITVVARTGFENGSRIERRVTFYHQHPRIDFETTVNMRARNHLVTADFPLAGTVTKRTRGIPFGFSEVDPRNVQPPNPYFLMKDHQTYGFSAAIQPAVRWSDYSLENGGGMALLDRGLTCHELNGNTVTLTLVNAQDYYRGLDNLFLTGQGVRTLQYALWPHTGDWRDAAIARHAWEYNSPVILSEGRNIKADKPIITTSDNVIVQAVRRVEGDVEVRLAEWSGRAGEAEVRLNLPHRDARMTNLMGENERALTATNGAYRFKVRPQQIVTLRFRAGSTVPRPEAIRSWNRLVPRFKRQPLEVTDPVKGYPDITSQPSDDDFGMKKQ